MDTSSRHPERPGAASVWRRTAFVLAAIVSCACGVNAGAQDPDTTSTGERREWAYPSKGPTHEEAKAAGADPHWWEHGPWYAAASFGPAWFHGDGIDGSTDFAAEGRIARDVSDEVYLVGAYTFALAETDSGSGSGGNDSHDLHMLTFGAGLRWDVTPEVQLFIEPRAGVLFGSDADAAPVGMVSGGVDVLVTEGVFLRFAITGLVTDSDISTDGDDAHLDSGVIGSLGITFEL